MYELMMIMIDILFDMIELLLKQLEENDEMIMQEHKHNLIEIH